MDPNENFGADVTRTVWFYRRDDWGTDPQPGYKFQYDVIMSWALDEDGLARTEIGHGDTPEEAFRAALLLAASFMACENVAGDGWPDNGIDQWES